MVPLVGLGSDQVNNSRNSTNLIEAYHLDENRGVDGYALRRRLLSLLPREANRVSIFLHASPQSLKVGSFWYKYLFQLASMNSFKYMLELPFDCHFFVIICCQLSKAILTVHCLEIVSFRASNVLSSKSFRVFQRVLWSQPAPCRG